MTPAQLASEEFEMKVVRVTRQQRRAFNRGMDKSLASIEKDRAWNAAQDALAARRGCIRVPHKRNAQIYTRR